MNPKKKVLVCFLQSMDRLLFFNWFREEPVSVAYIHIHSIEIEQLKKFLKDNGIDENHIMGLEQIEEYGDLIEPKNYRVPFVLVMLNGKQSENYDKISQLADFREIVESEKSPTLKELIELSKSVEKMKSKGWKK